MPVSTIQQLLDGEGSSIAHVREAISSAPCINEDELSFRAPFSRPGQIIALARTYSAHTKKSTLPRMAERGAVLVHTTILGAALRAGIRETLEPLCALVGGSWRCDEHEAKVSLYIDLVVANSPESAKRQWKERLGAFAREFEKLAEPEQAAMLNRLAAAERNPGSAAEHSSPI